MTWKLTTHLFHNDRWEDLTERISGLTMYAALHGGLQSIEFALAGAYVDAYRWAYDRIGAMVYVCDNGCTPPVAEGRILDPSISHDGTRIHADGPWFYAMFNQVYNDTATWVAAGQTGAQIKHMLTNECPGVSTDQSNVDEPGTNNFPWQPTDNAYPGNLIAALAALSDASNKEWYFWLRSAPLAGAAPRAPIPWFQYHTAITKIFQCSLSDMPGQGLDLSPSLRKLANDVRVMYRDAVGTQQQTASSTDANSQARYGLREQWDYDLGPASPAAAAQYRNLLLARYKDPQQSLTFNINTWIRDMYGGRWPLWRLIADFPVRFTVNDLIADNLVAGHELDNRRTFITLAAQYEYDANILTITPDTEDNRADALLARHRAFK